MPRAAQSAACVDLINAINSRVSASHSHRSAVIAGPERIPLKEQQVKWRRARAGFPQEMLDEEMRKIVSRLAAPFVLGLPFLLRPIRRMGSDVTVLGRLRGWPAFGGGVALA